MRALPNLRQLQYLAALAEHMHFGKAAEACAVTQSTLSAGIHELEMLTQVKVAERTKRSVILTPVGQRLVQRARIVLREAEALMDEALSAAEPMAGLIEMGTIPTIGPFVLPRLVPHVTRQFPRLRLVLREDRTAPLLDRLAGGRLDVLLMAFPYLAEGCETMMLFEDAYRFACDASHPLSQADAVGADAMQGEPVMLLERDHCLHSHALPVLDTAQANAVPDFASTSLHTLVAMVAEGLGTTLLPDLAINGGILQGTTVVVRPLSGESNARQIGLCWRKQAARAETFRRLGESIREWVAANVRPWTGAPV